MRNRALRVGAALSCLVAVACGDVTPRDVPGAEPDVDAGEDPPLDAGATLPSVAEPSWSEARTDAPDELVEISYRGVPRTAARYGDVLIIDGDIVVGSRDLEPVDSFVDELHGGGIVTKSVHTSGPNGSGALYQWPSGVVPYTFDSNVSSAPGAGGGPSQQDLFLAAAKEWMKYTPGINFVARTTQTDYVTFRITTAPGICGQSHVGRQGNQQFIDVAAGCLAGYSTQHEIGHALGLFHEQSRTDLAANITINWNNIKGCPDSATSRQDCTVANCSPNPLTCGCTANEITNGGCFFAGNFGASSTSADVGDYDFDSVMHYGQYAFSKCADAMGTTVLCSAAGAFARPTLIPPPGVAIGQRGHLSNGDLGGMKAMYPTASLHSPLFSDTGVQHVCQLLGREDDVGTDFLLSGFPGGNVASTDVATSNLSPGSYSVSCSAKSLFWSEGYGYPNTSITPNVPGAATASVESYSDSEDLVVLDRGLIPVMF